MLHSPRDEWLRQCVGSWDTVRVLSVPEIHGQINGLKPGRDGMLDGRGWIQDQTHGAQPE